MRISKNTLVIIALLIIQIASVAVTIRNRKILDSQGRQIRFHGPNVVVKVPPYMPERNFYDPVRSFSKQDMQNLKKWGFNGIRLGMMWAGVEPTPSGYNETYLNQMEALINEAGSYGIYTLIDFHQDLIAEKYCGDGVPTWLIDEIKGYRNFPFPIGKKIKLNATGLPSWQDCDTQNWGTYYFSHDVSHTFQELYKAGSKLNKKFTQFWKKIATRFKDNKYVIAYQFINQPFPGNPYKDLAILIPSVGQRLNFQNFYDNLAQEIRKIDTQTPICFQPITFDQKIPVGFEHPPGGNRYKNLSILCYHYYKPPALGLGTIDARVKDGERLGVPSMMNQFGTISNQVLQKVQQYQQSWMFWGYKSFGKNWGGSPFSNYQYNKHTHSQEGYSEIDHHVRTYIQRISGNLVGQNFNPQTCQYTVSYEATPGGTSVIFFSREKHYRNGIILLTSPHELLETKQNQDSYLEVTYTGQSTRLISIWIQKA